MQESGVTFCPVLRSTEVDHSKEPNDEAITLSMQKLLEEGYPGRIALLTSDSGFVEATFKLKASGATATALIPNSKHKVIARYMNSGVQGLTLDSPNKDDGGSRVRAILHSC